MNKHQTNLARDAMGPMTHRMQYAALPWRWKTGQGAGADQIEVMLVSSRETRRWIVPKGWPMKKRTPAEAAAQEAYEEAGIVGAVSPKPMGTYTYDKRLRKGTLRPCLVEVFPLEVADQLSTWPEAHERKTSWFPATVAAEYVQEQGLRTLIQNLDSIVRAQIKQPA